MVEKGIFNEHICQNIAMLEKYIGKARNQGLESVTSKMILKGTIPRTTLEIFADLIFFGHFYYFCGTRRFIRTSACSGERISSEWP